ncbi:hypothetical protein QR680_017329 [Steinernema hermaphroditum]|uniref:Uncharacterized protein n=1 Tax=Steinernema hermaphroditum TaxID=289476 RepID=A0AA39HGJ6_9BILA|nr:hypothetical protein QR680_017329 [Steinernema hermaphroditum]
MSGPYRSLIALAQSRLAKYTDQVEEWNANDTDWSPVENLKVLNFIDNIERTIGQISEQNEKWTAYIQTLAGEKLTVEEAVHDTWAQKPDSFLVQIDRAYEALNLLRAKHREYSVTAREPLSPLVRDECMLNTTG